MEEQPNTMDRIIDRLGVRLSEWEEWSEIAIENETNFKDRKSTRLNSSHVRTSRMPSSA